MTDTGRGAGGGRGVLHLDLNVRPRRPPDDHDLTTARQRALRIWSEEYDHGLATQDEPDQQRRLEDAAVQRRLAALDGAPHARPAGSATVVIAHRVDWFRILLEAELRTRGLVVSASTSLRDEALAAVLVDQPDVLVVSDRLPRCSGLAVAQRARTLSPDTVVVAQVEADGNLRAAREVGVHAVLSRSARLQDLIDVVAVLAVRQARLMPG